ncbi:MAG: patatin-like phospholipase family protein [Kiritimatiellia bacterium]
MAKRILFVRSGGGMPGIDVHLGMWAALEQFAIVATDCSGTSAGAIVSAIDATGYSAARAISIVRNLKDEDVRREVPFWKFRIPWIDSYLRQEPIRQVLDGLLKGLKADKPLQVWAADRMSGDPCNLLSDPPAPLVDAVLASMSISGVFPPVKIGDDYFVDGGVAVNLPVPRDLAPYDEVWLLVAAGSPKDYQKNTGILTCLMRNIDFLMIGQLRESILDASAGWPSKKVRVLWPTIHRRGGAFHFDHDLIGEAYMWTKTKLQELQDGGLL